ncbi:MAG TPA: hypothetical protein VHG53_00160 [Candidatus Limnocylindria bacterium]|nr:hypothetical protein [Candidatus Limnocylindria bacterium]
MGKREITGSEHGVEASPRSQCLLSALDDRSRSALQVRSRLPLQLGRLRVMRQAERNDPGGVVSLAVWVVQLDDRSPDRERIRLGLTANGTHDVPDTTSGISVARVVLDRLHFRRHQDWYRSSNSSSPRRA